MKVSRACSRRTHSVHQAMSRLSLLFASSAALLFSACGGGSSSPPEEAPPPPTTVDISGVVADGPLRGALACYDLNDNLACDSGEPTSSPTDANGNYAITVLMGDAGLHAVIANVPATATDLDTGAAIGVALSFMAPATGSASAQPVFVSPLTTLVMQHMTATRSSASEAAAFVQAQAGMAISPLADFSGSSAAAVQAQQLSRLSVLTYQQVVAALAPSLGQSDGLGGTVSQDDIDKAAAQAVLNGLQPMASALGDPAIAGAADLQAALTQAAQALVATQPALDPAAALAVVTGAKAPVSAETTEATATLRSLVYTDANNWSYRAMLSSAADNTVNSAGLKRFYDEHRKLSAGVPSTWGYGSDEARKDDLAWNGSTWSGCDYGFRSTQTPRDAQGRSDYNYCGNREIGASARTEADISGLTMTSVVIERMRTFPGEDSGVPYAQWGPDNLDLLGTATFPVGSRLYDQLTTPSQAAPVYIPASPVTTWGTEAAAGGDARNNDTLPCVAAFNGAITPFNVGTLEQLRTVNTGSPCTVNPGTDASGSSLDPNLWWSASSVSMGSVEGAVVPPTGTGGYFTTTANLRVAFTGGGNAVSYYSCLVRSSNGGARSCTSIGSGSYVIETLGDARVMSFSNLPALAQRLDNRRVFVERGGTVYVGYQAWTGITRSTRRMNLTAANAIFGTLGLAPLAP